ncbi:hypothetical protein ACE1CB_18350 [Aerosakkonema sp. BLCC-F2]
MLSVDKVFGVRIALPLLTHIQSAIALQNSHIPKVRSLFPPQIPNQSS